MAASLLSDILIRSMAGRSGSRRIPRAVVNRGGARRRLLVMNSSDVEEGVGASLDWDGNRDLYVVHGEHQLKIRLVVIPKPNQIP